MRVEPVSLAGKKLEILSRLKELAEKGEFLSGEEVANVYRISRPAIWKHIKYFKKLGYEIESKPKRGYRLLKVPDILHPLEYFPYLTTDKFARQAYYFETISSTNFVALSTANEPKDGAVVITEYQTMGRGRYNRKWHAPYGKSILFSLVKVVDWEEDDPLWGFVPPYVGMILSQVINNLYNLDAKVRWPNDVVIEGKKVAGVLVERHRKVMVIGVGINANGSVSEYPIGLREAICTLQGLVGEKINRNKLFAEIMNTMERRWFRLSNEYKTLLVDDWNAMCYGLGEKVVVLTKTEELVKGTLLGLDERTGGLRVKLNEGGEELVFSSDNVYYVKC